MIELFICKFIAGLLYICRCFCLVIFYGDLASKVLKSTIAQVSMSYVRVRDDGRKIAKYEQLDRLNAIIEFLQPRKKKADKRWD